MQYKSIIVLERSGILKDEYCITHELQKIIRQTFGGQLRYSIMKIKEKIFDRKSYEMQTNNCNKITLTFKPNSIECEYLLLSLKTETNFNMLIEGQTSERLEEVIWEKGIQSDPTQLFYRLGFIDRKETNTEYDQECYEIQFMAMQILVRQIDRQKIIRILLRDTDKQRLQELDQQIHTIFLKNLIK